MSRRYVGSGAAWTRTVDPDSADLAVSLSDYKAHARIVQTAGDSILTEYLVMAHRAAEDYLGRGLATQTWRLELHHFADAMYLPMAAPLQNDATPPSTEPVITYYDTDGTLQTLAATYYTVDTTSRPGRILRAANQCWPSLQNDRGGARVFITYIVGYVDVADVPDRIKQGIRLYTSAQDVDRDGTNADARMQLEDAAKRCWDDRVGWIEPLGCEAWS